MPELPQSQKRSKSALFFLVSSLVVSTLLVADAVSEPDLTPLYAGNDSDVIDPPWQAQWYDSFLAWYKELVA